MLTFQFLLGTPDQPPTQWKQSSLYPAPTLKEALKTYKKIDMDTPAGLFQLRAVRAVYQFERLETRHFRLPILVNTAIYFTKGYDFEIVELSDFTYLDAFTNPELISHEL